MSTDIQSSFTDLEFEKACQELWVPDTDGWEFFVESHDVSIYRLFDKDSGLYRYKTYGELKDISPEICAEVYMDVDYRRQWDSYVKELTVKEVNGKNLIYWNINFPFPLWNRDYVYERELRVMESQGNKCWVVMAQSAKTEALPPVKGVVRVDDYFQSCVLTDNGQGGSKAFINYYDNPGGNIPKWLINWAAKTGVPQFLGMMQDACRKYPEYLNKKEKH